MSEPRAPTSQEYNDVVKFFTSHLRSNVTWSIADEYPQAISPNNLNLIRIIQEEGRIVSGAVVRPTFVKSFAGLFKVAGIGSVVTDPQYRQQGLSRTVLDHTLQVAKNEACDIAILWSNLHDFYRKIGFELGGTEVSIKIEKELNVPVTGQMLEDHKVSPEAIARLYSQHTSGTLRSIEDIRKSLQIPNSRVYTLWNERRQMLAYAVEGKGADLTGYIHEWGGGVPHILSLLGQIYKKQNKPLTVICPAHAKNLIRQLTELGCVAHEGVLGMIKIINPLLLFAKLIRHSRSQGLSNLVLDYREGKFYFGFGEEIYCTDSEADMIRLIFGPAKASEIHDFSPLVKSSLESIFPIPFWVWGWDSV